MLKIPKPQKQYYCLVAGLPEFSFDNAGSFDLFDLRSQIRDGLSVEDLRAVESLYSYYDISNLIGAITGSNVPFNQLGNLTPQEISAEIEAVAVDDEPFQTQLPSAIATILDRYKGRVQDDEGSAESIAVDELENHLWAHYYQLAAASDCRFIRLWGATDRSIRNIIAASRARTAGMDPATVMVGEGEIELQITTSSAADFGLKGEFEYFDALWSVIETEDFVERERKMDALRWSIAGELTDQDYFNIDHLLAYLVRLNILYRWSALDKTTGAERFRQIVESFTRDVQL